MEAALVAEDVTKAYGETLALDGVSLSVRRGEVLALVGPNGAGKTTLVRTLTGTTRPTEGRVALLGEEPFAVDRSRIGVLPQAFAPPERLTARELLTYYAGLYAESRDPAAVLEEVGLASAADTRYEALSGGQKRRVCLGAALVNDPEVLVLDEPTSGIDPAGRRTVRRHVADLAEGGTTVLVTTHDMDEAERLADRVALLADGRLRAVGSPGELIREHGGAPSVVVELTDSPEGAEGSRSHGADPGIEDGQSDGAVQGVERDEAVRRALDRAGFDAAVADGELVVEGVDAGEIGAVVDALSEAGATYDGLVWRQPSLEDVYMALAGDEESGLGAGRRSDERARSEGGVA